ncbi:hypothetical protein ACIPWE_38590 [Streptomyces sp. NPDC090073]|uniref:hypothetical protein n=1 Tax=Streptomyces sp. NPDC090073 TaxID=3365936 RepID=UPI0038282D1A
MSSSTEIVQPVAPVKHHWVMTIQTADGRQATTDGVIDVAPGVHTRESSYSEVLRAVKQWAGSDNATVLFFALAPNQL